MFDEGLNEGSKSSMQLEFISRYPELVQEEVSLPQELSALDKAFQKVNDDPDYRYNICVRGGIRRIDDTYKKLAIKIYQEATGKKLLEDEILDC